MGVKKEKGTPVARRVRKARGLSKTAQPPNFLNPKETSVVMRGLLSTRKRRLTTAVLLALLAMSGAAVAYWTSSGEGTGTAKSNYAGASFEVTSALVENLYPGGSVSVAVKVKDTDASISEYLTKLEAEIKETSVAECKKEWFELTPASQEPKVLIAHGETKEYTFTLKMKEEAAVNQNSCKAATITLHYKAS